jgi:hypothetical protein
MHPVIEKCLNGEDITWQEYCEGASCTLSNSWHGDRYPIATAMAIMEQFLEISDGLDELKKSLFYGDNKYTTVEEQADHHRSEYGNPYITVDSWDDVLIDRRLIHSILGVATEAAELVNALYRAIVEKEELDGINIIEELGDLTWYMHIPWIVSDNNSGLSPVFRKNLVKLYTRYGDKFSSERAVNRDLGKERAVLEETL